MSQARVVGLYRARSRIEGEGAFTSCFIPRGTHVLDCSGILLTGAEVEEAPDSLRVMQVGPDSYLAEDPNAPGIDDFLNHCCDPNVGFRGGRLSMHALRDIAAGEELSFDYSTCMNEPGWSMPCGCSAKNCRGVVRSFCDMPELERRRLRGLTLAYMLEEITDKTG